MTKLFLFVALGAFLVLVVCADEPSAPFNDNVSSTGTAKKFLYVVSGACYGGGVTTSTGSNTIAKFDLNTGALEKVVVDYNAFAGDAPVSIAEYDATRLLVLVENAAGRRIDIVNRDGTGLTTYLSNATILSAVLRSMILLSDYSLLISKSTAIEKVNAAKVRVTAGVNPYVNAPAGSCATATTLMSSVMVYPNGKIFFAHAAATPNNRIGLIASTGYNAAADCLVSIAGPTTTALPSASLIHSSGKTLVAYGSTTSTSNFVYSYDVNTTANTIGNAIATFNDYSTINGPSAMAEDPASGMVYIANANSTFNTIERFTYAGGNNLLNRVSGSTYMLPNIYSRCVSAMKVME